MEFSKRINPCTFNTLLPISPTELLIELNELYVKIDNEKCEIDDVLEKALLSASSAFEFLKPVEIDDDTKNIISSFAKNVNHTLSTEFFSLGLLRESTVSISALIGGRSLEGDLNEREKYDDIIKLKDKIMKYIGWDTFSRVFCNISCVRLVVINEGTTFDEDIEIALVFPRDMLILPEDLPIPDKFAVDTIGNDSSLYEIFGISRTAKYNDFESSITAVQQPVAAYTPSVFPFGNTRDYKEDYLDDLNEIFDYHIFDEGENIMLKLHIDYLKHNTAVAFPSVIFVTDKLSDVSYTISSKHGEKIAYGTITVE
jgi:hypothetical protein